MTILCLGREQYHWKLIPGYADAFRRRGIEFFCVDDSIPFDAPREDVLQTCPGTPSAIFHFESAHPLFHPDTHAFTERRIHWSAVFDHPAVFHSGYEERFKRAGHPGAFLLPHVVRKDCFQGIDPSREFEIGWVGQTAGEFYKTRAQWLPKLGREFRTNDWSSAYIIIADPRDPEMNTKVNNAVKFREWWRPSAGVPVIMNTSFNLRGEAIVHTPSDALRTFFSSGMYALVIGSFPVEK